MKFSRLLFATAFAAIAPLAVQAQHSPAAGAPDQHLAPGETHAHSAPHGGVVRSASPYHLELVQHPTEMHIYLLGAKMVAVPNNGTTGSVMLQTTDNKTSTVALTPAGDDHFIAKILAGTTVRTAIVSLNASGKALNVRFDKLDAAKAKPGQAVGAAYACPMNCEGSASDKPGNCPKCGMALVKKS